MSWQRARAAVERLLFGPVTGEAGALFRIAFGLLLLWFFCAGVGPNLERYFTEEGVLPLAALRATGGTPWTLLALGRGTGLTHAVWIVSVAAAACFTAGLWARPAAAVAWIGALSFYNRNPLVMNSGDQLLLILCFLSIFAPLSRRLSVSAWWRARSGAPAPAPALAFGISLIQLEIVLVYFWSAFHKLRQPAWREGTAIGTILELARYSRGGGGLGGEVLPRVLTYGTLLVEGLFFLVFVKKLRPWVLAAGIALHLSIEALMTVPMFSAVMLVSYLALIDDSEASSIIRWSRRRRSGSA